MQLATRCVRQKCKPITVHVLTGIHVKAEIHYTGTRVCDHIWITQRSHSNNKRGKTKQGCTLPRKAGRPGYVFLPHTAILFPLILDVCIVGDGDRQWDSTVKKQPLFIQRSFLYICCLKKTNVNNRVNVRFWGSWLPGSVLGSWHLLARAWYGHSLSFSMFNKTWITIAVLSDDPINLISVFS